MAVQFPKLLYDNRFADGVITSPGTATGNYAPENVRDWRGYTWWKGNAAGSWVQVDCGVAKAADYLAVYGHDIFSRSGLVHAMGADDAAFTVNVTIPVNSYSPASDAPFVRQFSSVARRHWRFYVQGASQAPAVAVVAIGAALTMPRPLSRGFDPLGRTVQGVVNRSEKGHPLGRAVEFEEWTAQLDFSLLSPTWIRNTWLPAWRTHLRGRPFLFAWDPGDHADEVRLVTAGDSFRSATSGAYCSLSFSVSGLA
ncbi:hypothetical protein [Microcystis phage Mae-JY22]